jgi:hypothetical protein
LAQDVPAVWHAPTTTQAERKQLLRCLIKDVTVTKRPTVITVAIRWQTEACTVLEVPRPLRAAEARRTPPAIVERIRTLAPPSPTARAPSPSTAKGGTRGSGVPSRRRKWPGSAMPTRFRSAALKPLGPARPANEAMAATPRGRPRRS